MEQKRDDESNRRGEWRTIPQAIGMTAVEKAVLFGFLLGLAGALVIMMSMRDC